MALTDCISDLEDWRERQEERRVNRASSPIDLTGDPDGDTAKILQTHDVSPPKILCN